MTRSKIETSRLPDFLCIGAQKAGTSWLDVNLRFHPDIWMPPIKELHYFDHLYVNRFRKWTNVHIQRKVREAITIHVGDTKPIDIQFIRYLCSMASGEMFTEKWYRYLFSYIDSMGKTLGEVTPEYSTIPKEGVQYLKELLGSPKIIYVIRHPVSRATSQIRMNLSKSFGNDILNAVEMLTKKDWLSAVNNWDVMQRGQYSKYVPTWCEQFSEKDLFFLPYQRIGNQPHSVLQELELFLGLKPHGKYPRAGRRVYSGQKFNLPEFAQSAVEELMTGEVKFLESHFGSDFVKLI